MKVYIRKEVRVETPQYKIEKFYYETDLSEELYKFLNGHVFHEQKFDRNTYHIDNLCKNEYSSYLYNFVQPRNHNEFSIRISKSKDNDVEYMSLNDDNMLSKIIEYCKSLNIKIINYNYMYMYNTYVSKVDINEYTLPIQAYLKSKYKTILSNSYNTISGHSYVLHDNYVSPEEYVKYLVEQNGDTFISLDTTKSEKNITAKSKSGSNCKLIRNLKYSILKVDIKGVEYEFKLDFYVKKFPVFYSEKIELNDSDIKSNNIMKYTYASIV